MQPGLTAWSLCRSGRNRLTRGVVLAVSVEYPTSFLSHLRTQKLNVFNIGVAFLTLSLSSQLVSYKQKHEAAQAQSAVLADRVQLLEDLVVKLGGVVPQDEEIAAAKADQELKLKREREEEAQLVKELMAPAAEKAVKKGTLI